MDSIAEHDIFAYSYELQYIFKLLYHVTVLYWIPPPLRGFDQCQRHLGHHRSQGQGYKVIVATHLILFALSSYRTCFWVSEEEENMNIDYTFCKNHQRT